MGSWSNGCGRTFESESPEEPPAAVYETEEEERQDLPAEETKESDSGKEKVTELMTGDKDDDSIRLSVGLSGETIPGLLAGQKGIIVSTV